MASEEERFDPAAARKARKVLAEKLDKFDKMLADMDDPKGLGGVSAAVQRDSSERSLTKDRERRAAIKSRVAVAREHAAKALAIIDRKLSEHEGN